MNKIKCAGSCTFSCNMIMAIKEKIFSNVTVYHAVIFSVKINAWFLSLKHVMKFDLIPALVAFAETRSTTIVPLVCKFCQQSIDSNDVTLPVVAKLIGKICHGLSCKYQTTVSLKNL